jgi:hypothetical protein
MWPQRWGRFFSSKSLTAHRTRDQSDLRRSPGWDRRPRLATKSTRGTARSALEEPPHKVRQQCEQQQHKHPANPYQEVQGHLRRVDFFLVHTPNASTHAAVRYNRRPAPQKLLHHRLWLQPENVVLTDIILEHLHSSTTGFPAPAPLRYTACTYDHNLSLRSILGCRNCVG